MLETLSPRGEAGLTRQAVDELVRRRREPDWLRQLRLGAFAAYERLPLPDQRMEGWRRTSLSGLQLDGQSPLGSGPAAGADGVTIHADGLDERVLVLELAEAARHPALAERVREHFGRVVPPDADKFTALHYAFCNAGAVVYVPRGAVVRQPIWVAHQAAQPGLAAFAHTLLLVDEGAELTCVDDYSSPPREGAPLASGAVELVLGRNAQVRYVHLQRWAADTWSFSDQRARLAADSSLRILNVAVGARLARNVVQVALEGKGSQADLLGVVALDGRQHVDFQTLQDHGGDNTRSDLVIHDALRGRSSANFTGLIRINKPAHGTESSQQQKNILLSPRARADSDPKLEILNNDVVRCTHGAAVGPVDPELLFYLRSRGLDRDTAEHLIVEGFFQAVLEKVAQPDLQAAIWSAVQAKLAS